MVAAHDTADPCELRIIRLSRLAPERRTSAERLKAALRDNPADEEFADDLEAAHADLQAAFTDEVRGWPAE